MSIWGLICLALGCSLAGLWLAFTAWRSRDAVLARLGGTAGLWIVSTWLWSRCFGAEIGIALAIETGALLALAFILVRAERRDDREPRTRLLPPAPPQRWHRLRGIARFLIGGPLAMFAAMGAAITIAIFSPMHEQTRLIVAGLIVPALWAMLILYAIMERRLLRSAGVLAFITIAGFGISILGRA